MEDFWLNRKVCDFSIVEFHLEVILHPAVEIRPILTQNSPHQRRNLIKLKHKNSFTKEILHTLRNLFSRTIKKQNHTPCEKNFRCRRGKSSEGNEGAVTYGDLTESKASLKYPPKYSTKNTLHTPCEICFREQ